MLRTHHRHNLFMAVLLAGGLALPAVAGATTTFYVRMDTTPWSGSPAALAFNLTSSDVSQNYFEIYEFTHDGVYGLPETQGGLSNGDLLLGLNPAYYTNVSDYTGFDLLNYFFTELRVNFTDMPTLTTFAINVSEYKAFGDEGLDDQVSVYLLTQYGGPLFHTADPLGAKALFSICVTGDPGGILEVFDPAVFIPPDTIVVNTSLLAVPSDPVAIARPRILGVHPVPASSQVTLALEVPDPGSALSLEAFDIQGRLVRRLMDGYRPGGSMSLVWSGDDDQGRRLGAGIYFLKLASESGASVRKVIFTR